MNGSLKQGPNVKRLLIEFMAKRQVDRAHKANNIAEFGVVGEIAADIIRDGGKAMALDAAGALEDAREAIALVRSAADPNPFKDSGDEEIAASIVMRLKAKRAERQRATA